MSDATLMMHQELVANVLATISRSSSSEPEMNENDDTNTPSNEIPAEIETQTTKKRRRYVTRKRMQVARPLLATTIQVIDKPRHYVNHSYNDFSSVLPEPDDVFPTKIEDMTFAHKLHHMLAQPQRFGKLIQWLPHGRAFKILVPTTFEREVLPIYFGHKRYSTFLRHLDNHGFKLLSSGPNRGSYYHECMLRGLPHLTKYMPEAREARRKLPDPENEPNFDSISQRFPLPQLPCGEGSVSAVLMRSSSPASSEENAPTIVSVSDDYDLSAPPAKRLAMSSQRTRGSLSSTTASSSSSSLPSRPVPVLIESVLRTLGPARLTPQQMIATQILSSSSGTSSLSLSPEIIHALLSHQQQQQHHHQNNSPVEVPTVEVPNRQPNRELSQLEALVLANRYFKIVG